MLRSIWASLAAYVSLVLSITLWTYNTTQTPRKRDQPTRAANRQLNQKRHSGLGLISRPKSQIGFVRLSKRGNTNKCSIYWSVCIRWYKEIMLRRFEERETRPSRLPINTQKTPIGGGEPAGSGDRQELYNILEVIGRTRGSRLSMSAEQQREGHNRRFVASIVFEWCRLFASLDALLGIVISLGLEVAKQLAPCPPSLYIDNAK